MRMRDSSLAARTVVCVLQIAASAGSTNSGRSMFANGKIACDDIWPSSDIVERIGRVAMPRPVTIVLAGAGSRGSTFSSFAEQYPDRARVVAVADPRSARREALANQLGVAADKRFDDWRELAALDRFADAVII